jgi:hypothetical protein
MLKSQSILRPGGPVHPLPGPRGPGKKNRIKRGLKGRHNKRSSCCVDPSGLGKSGVRQPVAGATGRGCVGPSGPASQDFQQNLALSSWTSPPGFIFSSTGISWGCHSPKLLNVASRSLKMLQSTGRESCCERRLIKQVHHVPGVAGNGVRRWDRTFQGGDRPCDRSRVCRGLGQAVLYVPQSH